jgi:hypothetical protein
MGEAYYRQSEEDVGADELFLEVEEIDQPYL